VIEARETDEQFFDMNPLAFWKRHDAVQHGYDSVRATLTEHAEVLQPLFEGYGIEFRVPAEESQPVPEPAESREDPLDSPSHIRLVPGA
jgi:hypothetical protein